MHMARTTAKTVEQYLDELPEDRRAVMAEMRKLIRRNLPKGYEETMNWGMVSYEIPLDRHPETYNGQPLGYVALAAQKNYYALYLLGAMIDPKQGAQLQQAFDQAGKRMDMGKSCLRFKSIEDVPLPALAKIIASTPPEKLIEMHEKVHPPKKKR
jgi:hypothetical protein